MRASRIAVVLAILLSVLGAAHYYVWLRLVDGGGLAQPLRGIATVALVLLGASIPASFFVLRRASRRVGQPFAFVAYTWMGFGMYLLLALAVGDLARVLGLSSGGRTSVLACVLAAAAITLYGLGHAARGFRVRRVRIALPRLPREGAGYKIVQLSDLHVGPLLGRRYARRVATVANVEQPDLIVITGDLVDGLVDRLAAHVAPLAELRARDGVYFVTGNHEYYWDANAWLAFVDTLGIRALRNERVRIRDLFELAGVDDVSAAGMLPGHGEDVARAVTGRDPALPLILLAHHPRTIDRAGPAGCDLQLSGHVHGGQMLPLGWLARVVEPHISGLFRVGTAQLYVSEGTGFWGPPLRVGTTSEITVITLEPL